jgi:DNA modification methylase
MERQLTIRRVALDALIPDPANARTHGPENMAAIEASLARFGQAEPLVVHAGTGRVIGGNGRLAAMKKLGWTEADVVELDLNSVDATALGIALNRTGELAEWDSEALSRLLASLRDEGALDGVGFNNAELDELLAQFDDATNDIEDVEPEEPPEHPVTRLGDLWMLAEHRLLCGDSTKPEDIARLMDGERAQLLATDPPYLVDYTAGNHPPSSCNSPATANKNWDAYKDPQTGIAFFDGFLKACLPHVEPDAAIYQWHATRRQALVEQAWELNDLLVHQTIIWVKSRAVLTRSMYMWQHEPCFFGWVRGNMPPKERRPPHNATTVWHIDQAGEDRPDHPTPKALEIFTRPLEYHTRPNEIALEPFSGSGTQIIAAEKLRRRCFAMELAPGFVDVAVVRWMKATGKQATLDGRTFDEVKEARHGATAQGSAE